MSGKPEFDQKHEIWKQRNSVWAWNFYNPQNEMFWIFQTKRIHKHKIQKCNSLNARLSFSCQSIRFLVNEVNVSSAYFCYKFVVCLIFLHFFQKIWLLMNLYIPLQRGSCNH